MRNDRAVSSQWDLSKRRLLSYATNITSWTDSFDSHNDLICPKCEGSILRCNFDAPDRIVFVNPASTVSRSKMPVRLSYDNGATWPISRALYPALTEQQCIDQGKGGYSSIAKTADFQVGTLIEINEDPANSATSHRSIEFPKFNLAWILNGASEPRPSPEHRSRLVLASHLPGIVHILVVTSVDNEIAPAIPQLRHRRLKRPPSLPDQARIASR